MFPITTREIKVRFLVHGLGELETINVLTEEPDSH